MTVHPSEVSVSLWWELRVLTEVPRLLIHLPGLLAGQPRASGEPVLVIPGFGASDRSTRVLRAYSRHDGVVRWPACLDHHNPQVEHVEVVSSHSGLGFHPEVYRLLRRLLAAP